jgi:L-aminopeptidase/D-esterase-like protein
MDTAGKYDRMDEAQMTSEIKAAVPGTWNALTDVEGIEVGHHTDLDALCGVTAILCREGAVAGVDVRGAAPGTRETDLLAPVNLVSRVQAVVLSGGSVYGLSTADGVVRYLEGEGCGFPLEGGHVAPIVPAAVLYDLGRGTAFVPPVEAAWGRMACERAGRVDFETGCVGAGTGAVAGGIKGGLGTASCRLPSGVTVAAVMAVNSLGSVIDPLGGRPWEIGLELAGEFGPRRRVALPPAENRAPATNTTIGVVATDAVLEKAEAQKVAQMAQDGLARAIRPAHTMFDGDTIFCLATARKKLPETQGVFVAPHAQALNELGHAAADCVSRAIIHGILNADSLGGITAFADLPLKQLEI